MNSFQKYLHLSYQYGLILSVAVLSACAPKKQIHGYTPRPSEIAKLQVGKMDKTTIVNIIGTPSFINVFADNRWSYVSFKTEQIGFEKPNVTEYKVLQLVFNENSLLERVETYNKDHLIPIEFDEEITPASGRVLTITKQLLGNLGKFN